MLALHVLAIFTGSTLLFLVQQWNTAMVFFQAALLAGFLLALGRERLRWALPAEPSVGVGRTAMAIGWRHPWRVRSLPGTAHPARGRVLPTERAGATAHGDIVISSAVAQLVVRNVEEDVKRRLQRRAARHGHSMEEEVRDILRDALKEESRPVAPLGSRLAARFAGLGLAQEIPELRGGEARAATFDE